MANDSQTQTSYLMIRHPGESRLEVKRSVFIGLAAPVTDEAQAGAVLAQQRARYPDARHQVYAWRIHQPQQLQRFSDDGEPHGTAGQPVLSVLTGAGLWQSVVVVTRYFGGILLGTGGLVRAYTDASRMALAAAGISRMTEGYEYRMELPYALYERLNRTLIQHGWRPDEPQFSAEVSLRGFIPAGQRSAFETCVQDSSQGQIRPSFSDLCYRPFELDSTGGQDN
ncbi:DUF1949 domain-containing protein [Oscillospiraceae bacterium HV4-5-C5C]|nr:DUF1949 domain-containing protein [Oscillospiraceae bacterium HV4-5-C5C]